MSSAPGLTAAVTRSISDIPRGDWDACFPGDPEGWAYYRAIEESGLTAFSFAYFLVREHGRVVAVAPAFMTDYSLDTMIQGSWRTLLQPLARSLGRLLTLRILCLGSPLADACHLGFAPDLARSRHPEALACLLAIANEFATAHGIRLLAVKDLADAGLDPGLDAAFAAAGYARQPGLPNTVVALPPGGESAYLDSLSRAARRELRRKLRSADQVRIELRRGIEAADRVPEMFRLYEAQRSRSKLDFDQFEMLTPAYFQNVLAGLGQAAVVFFYFHQDRLLAFNLCYHSERLFVDKFIGFDSPLSRRLNLYVLSWITNVRYCLERGIAFLQAGQTGYPMKLRLGSTLRPNWILFRHRNPVLHAILRLASPLLSARSQNDDHS